ncbi:MAG: NADH-quinone oxidoreductase subunit H [Victivallales bacterium]|nr:NADH-quinone oxidoreductase subunit H [Victivallales bacterium]MCF7888536.1 NADH-quinone oxidoreductase subunit H [Victivallales bacterium]
MTTTSTILVILFIILAPVIGGIISGGDRIISAKMQSRVGPPIVQPFYDVLKLMGKENLVVNRYHGDYMICFLIFTIVSGCLFFGGNNLLLVIFALIVAGVFLVLAAYCTNSPYALIGAERELLQMLAAEPMIILSAVGLYVVTGTFDVYGIANCQHIPIIYLPGVFIALTYVLTIKLRKSPFDLSTSHHAHQELVKGLTTEFAGPSLGLFEIAHWYETVLLLAMIFLFFGSYWILGIILAVIIYFIEILIDNINARIKWELMLISAWAVTLILGVGNLMILYFVFHI